MSYKNTVKDYSQMIGYITRDKTSRDPSAMDQEPRNMYNQGSSVDHAVRTMDPVQDSGHKIDQVLGAYRRYRRGEKNPRLSFSKFFKLFSTENFATGGQAGQLVSNTVDGSRPGYNGKKLDKANEKRKIESVNKLYTKYGKKVIDDAAKQWAKISNLEVNRKTPLKIQNLDKMENAYDRSNFKTKFKDDIEKYKKWID